MDEYQADPPKVDVANLQNDLAAEFQSQGRDTPQRNSRPRSYPAHLK